MNPWDNIKHFTPSEFDSPDAVGSGLLMNIEFVAILDKLRDKCGFPFIINSGYRTVSHNKTVGGKSESAHTKGIAVDIGIYNSMARMIFIKNAIELGIRRYGIGDTFVHIDMDFDLPQDVMWLYGKLV